MPALPVPSKGQPGGFDLLGVDGDGAYAELFQQVVEFDRSSLPVPCLDDDAGFEQRAGRDEGRRGVQDRGLEPVRIGLGEIDGQKRRLSTTITVERRARRSR